MSKYIDADALKVEIDKRFYDFPVMVKDMKHMVDDMPAADVEPVVRWISVDERLPEYKESQGANAYWVAWKKRNGEFGMRLALYCDYGYAMGIEGIPTKVTWRDWNFHVVENVTHWMNLPEPPKMDGGSEE